MRRALVPILFVPPNWLPKPDGLYVSVYADFVNQRYWHNRKRRPDFDSWRTALSGTLDGSSSRYYTNSAGLLVSTTGARFDYAGGVSRGLLLEGARTNVCLWNRDLTNAAWTASNVTVAKDQTGADGSANSASSLTATAGNGTVLQAITLASSARFQSAYVKRLTGTGAINMTMDNGSTWTAIVPTAAWSRLTIPTQTLANPTVGFRIVTSGDAIAVDYVQNEAGTFQTSPIATTTVSVPRAADSLIFTPISAWFNDGGPGTVLAAGASDTEGGLFPALFGLRASDNNNLIDCYFNGLSGLGYSIIAAGASQLGGIGQAGSGAIRTAFAWASNNVATVLNGGSVATDTSVVLPTGITSFRIGTSIPSESDNLAGVVSKIGYWPARVSNGGLQALTA